MPRKSRKKSLLDTQKQPLLFLEPPLDGARHHSVPQVLGALYPKSFVTEKHGQTNNTASSSWVTPQFDQVQLRAAPGRRGRRFQTTSISDRSSQLSRKTRVCKYPSLSFENKTVAQSNQQKHAHAKRAADTVAGRGLQTAPPVQRAVPDNAPKRRPSLRKRTAAEGTCLSSLSAVTPGGAATSGSSFEHCKTPASHTAARPDQIQGCSTVTPGSLTHRTPDIPGSFTLPDVETPDPTPDPAPDPTPSSAPSLRLLFPASQPSPPGRRPPDTLVGDTPERDYGLKVTWRRRRGLMKLLRDRGQLSSTEVQIVI